MDFGSTLARLSAIGHESGTQESLVATLNWAILLSCRPEARPPPTLLRTEPSRLTVLRRIGKIQNIMTISVLLVDDHELVRQGLRALLEGEPDLTLSGEAATADEALVAVRSLKPNVAVVDLALPGMNGLELTRQMTARHPDTKVLVLSMHADEAYVSEALRSGAMGYILKEAPSAEFVQGVRAVSGGEQYLSDSLSRRALASAAVEPSRNPFWLLTKRELQVLGLVAEGITSREIADRLEIGTRTIETHRSHIMRKLKLRSHSDLISFAVRHNLLTQPALPSDAP